VVAPAAPTRCADTHYTAEYVQKLHAVFTRVRDAENWKRPIDAVIGLTQDGELDLIVDAIRFYTGSDTVIFPLGNNRFRIVADGYYATLGA
jgi:hypothetical protein